MTEDLMRKSTTEKTTIVQDTIMKAMITKGIETVGTMALAMASRDTKAHDIEVQGAMRKSFIARKEKIPRRMTGDMKALAISILEKE